MQLTGFLFKEAVRGLSDGLRMLGAAPVRPEEKEKILAAVEHAVWGFPPDLFRDVEEEGWEERAAEAPAVREALEVALEPILLARKTGVRA